MCSAACTRKVSEVGAPGSAARAFVRSGLGFRFGVSGLGFLGFRI